MLFWISSYRLDQISTGLFPDPGLVWWARSSLLICPDLVFCSKTYLEVLV